MRFAYCAQSDVGRVRGNNEDSAFAGPHMLLVADGVGGQPAGEVASSSVAFALSAISMSPRGSLAAEPTDLLGGLRESVDFAFRHLSDGVAADPTRTGMATTLTAVLTNGRNFALAHIGDSRAYLLRNDQLSQLTTDHTFVQFLLANRYITEEQAATHPLRSAITRYINATDPYEPDLTLLNLRAGDRLLLTTDGLTDLVTDDQLGTILASSPREPAAQALISSALEAGGHDNITCIIGDVDSRELTPQNRWPYHCRLLGAAGDPRNLVDPTAPYRAA